MKDVIICILSIPLGYLISTFFVGVFQGIFLLFFPLTVYFLISPSEVHEKKNFQVILRAFYKTRGVYHSIKAPKEEK
ncbi:TPA: hypothetical protein ACN1ND_002725 [Enterococcus faecalis]